MTNGTCIQRLGFLVLLVIWGALSCSRPGGAGDQTNIPDVISDDPLYLSKLRYSDYDTPTPNIHPYPFCQIQPYRNTVLRNQEEPSTVRVSVWLFNHFILTRLTQQANYQNDSANTTDCLTTDCLTTDWCIYFIIITIKQNHDIETLVVGVLFCVKPDLTVVSPAI